MQMNKLNENRIAIPLAIDKMQVLNVFVLIRPSTVSTDTFQWLLIDNKHTSQTVHFSRISVHRLFDYGLKQIIA